MLYSWPRWRLKNRPHTPFRHPLIIYKGVWDFLGFFRISSNTCPVRCRRYSGGDESHLHSFTSGVVVPPRSGAKQTVTEGHSIIRKQTLTEKCFANAKRTSPVDSVGARWFGVLAEMAVTGGGSIPSASISRQGKLGECRPNTSRHRQRNDSTDGQIGWQVFSDSSDSKRPRCREEL